MSVDDLLTWVTQASLILIAILTLVDFFRHRDQTRLDIALMFGALAAIILLQGISNITHLPTPWLGKLGSILLLAQPYLLLRLVQHFRLVPPMVQRVALGGMVVTWAMLISLPMPLPASLALLIVAYFVYVEGYAVVAFARGALSTAGVTHQRLLLAAVASGLLTLVILLAGLNQVLPAWTGIAIPLSRLLALLSMLTYYISFAPPRWLRQAWQLAELRRFLHETAGHAAGERATIILDLLCLTGERAVGGLAAVVALWDEAGQRLTIRTSGTHLALAGDLMAHDGAIGRAWHDRQPTIARTPADFGLEAAPLAAAVGAGAFLAVPIATSEHAWGLLVVFLTRGPLFATDDLNLLVLLTEQSAIALDYAALFSISERRQAEETLRQSEERFRLLVDAALDAVITIDIQEAITAWNPQAENIFGWSYQEIIGQTLTETIIPPRYREAHQRGLKHFLATGEGPVLNKRIEITALHRDGHEFPIELSISTVKLGEVLTFSAFVRDITQRRQAEVERLELYVDEQAARAKAETTQQRLSFLVEASALLAESFDYLARLKLVADLVVPRIADWCAVDVLDEEGVLQRVAAVHTDPDKMELAYEMQRRYPPDPNAPGGVYNVLRSGQSEIYPEISDDLLVASVQDENHLTLIRRLGLKSAMVIPLLTHGQVLGVITVVSAESGRRFGAEDQFLTEDLARRAAVTIESARLYHTARRLNAELERRVADRTAQLEAANRELEAFSYSVAHDLRTPLRSIDGFCQALLEDYANTLDTLGQGYLQRVRAAAQRMGELIDSLLSLSRITRSELQRGQVDLSALAWSIVADLQQTQPERQVEWDIADRLVAEGDVQLLRVVLENLLGNAWKFTAQRCPRARIEVGALPQAQGAPVYFVRDDGVGFDMAYANKLFGVFQRLHSISEFAGTGIGLATVQRIIHRHGGRIWAEAAVDQGATFYFSV